MFGTQRCHATVGGLGLSDLSHPILLYIHQNSCEDTPGWEADENIYRIAITSDSIEGWRRSCSVAYKATVKGTRGESPRRFFPMPTRAYRVAIVETSVMDLLVQ